MGGFESAWPAFSLAAFLFAVGLVTGIVLAINRAGHKQKVATRQKIVLMQSFQQLSRGLGLESARLVYNFLAHYDQTEQKLIARAPHKYYQALEHYLLKRAPLRRAVQILAYVSGPAQGTRVESLDNIMRGELGALETQKTDVPVSMEKIDARTLKLMTVSEHRPQEGPGRIYIYRKHGGGFLLDGEVRLKDATSGEYSFLLGAQPRPAGDKMVMIEMQTPVNLEPVTLPHEAQESDRSLYTFQPVLILLSPRAAMLADNLPPETLRRKVGLWLMKLDNIDFKGKLLTSRKAGQLIFRFEDFTPEGSALIKEYLKKQEGTAESIN
ncbi:MAG: hypothetical protein HS115_12955 [Spirochaetales bacterium]|nr:hypothetical protein [Spirochaetales bacterium]